MSDNLPMTPGPPLPGQPADQAAPDREFVRGLEPGGLPADDGYSWRRYLGAVLRYKWLVLACGVLGVGAGVMLAKMRTAAYEANATLWLETTSRQEQGSGPVGSSQLFQTSGAWLNLLTSSVVIDPVVEERRLHIRAVSTEGAAAVSSLELAEQFVPEQYRLVVGPSGKSFTLSRLSGEVVDRGSVGDSIGRQVGFLWAPPAEHLPPGRTIDFVVRRVREVSQWLSGALITRMEGDNFLQVSLRAPSAQGAADLLNAIAEQYVEEAAKLKSAKYRELTKLLHEQLEHASRNLREAESALEMFRVRTITLPSEPATPLSAGLEMTDDAVFQNFFEMKVDEEQIRRDSEAIRRALAAATDSGLAVEALERIPSVMEASELSAALADLTERRAELRMLRGRYAEDHPTVKEAATTVQLLEERTIPQLAERLVAELAALVTSHAHNTGAGLGSRRSHDRGDRESDLWLTVD